MARKKRPESPTAKGLDPLALDYSASVSYDWALYPFDIKASIAHARMLSKQGIIPEADAKAIIRGLEEIEAEIEAGDFDFREDLEDIHLNIEMRLRERTGDAGARLHTARSRNDQVATDMRMYVKNGCMLVADRLTAVQWVLVDLADANVGVVMPGYTHLQRAQPVLLAHHLMAYFEMLNRDFDRFGACYATADVLPLGSGALGGAPYPIDREAVAAELDFEEISRNSIDAVSDRDFVLDFEYAAAMTMMHVSRLAEELVLWSGEEWGFVRMPDAFTTGSSIMPQKRNPDIAELARGRTGRVYGYLMGALTMLKGLPLAYNRDLQEDKPALFDTVSVLTSTLEVLAPMLAALEFDRGKMEAAATGRYSLATDLADHLVMKGLPFRDAHQAVRALVRYAEEHGKALGELTLEEYNRFSPLFDEGVLGIDARTSIESRDVPGGTATRRVKQAIRAARKELKARLE